MFRVAGNFSHVVFDLLCKTPSHRLKEIALHAGARPHLTAGIALLGAGMIAVTPVAPPMPDVEVAALQLAASIDPLAPWVDVFNTTSANATEVFDFFSESTVALQKAIVDEVGALGGLIVNNPTAIGDVLSAIGGNLEDMFAAATFAGVDVASSAGTALGAQTLDFNHLWALQYISGMDMGTAMGHVVQIPAVEPAAEIFTLLSSPLSGVLIGAVGPFVSPGVAVINSTGAFTDNLGAGDLSAAVQDLLAAPASAVGAFFNGATLNLDPLLPLLDQALQVPAGNEVTGASLAFGGLFTSGVTEAGNGGSLFNSLGLDLIMAGMGPNPYDASGEAIGPIGALADLLQIVAGAIG